MNFMHFISRLRTSLRAGAADPVGHYGMTFEGSYEPYGHQISGFVKSRGSDKGYAPAAVIVILNGQIAESTSQLTRSGNGWRFNFNFPEPFTARDVLRERVKVFALDHRGGRSELLIDGAVQLSYIRQAYAPPSETELIIEFSQGGNSRQYVQQGWSGPETEHTWTEAKQSTIELLFRSPGTRYGVEILAWPFTVADRLPSQTLEVSVADIWIDKFYVRPGQNLLEFDIPAEATLVGRAIMRLDLPDAARPCDVTTSPESRTLALAFRRLKLKRYLEVKTESSP